MLFKFGYMDIEFQAFMPERFLNILWSNHISLQEIKRINVTTFKIKIKRHNYPLIEKLASEKNVRLKQLKIYGLANVFTSVMKSINIIFCVALFVAVVLYLSSYLWGIDIKTDGSITPFEIRNELKSLGVKPGILKKSINVYTVERQMLNNENIMWIKIRLNGSKLTVDLTERQTVPKLNSDNTSLKIYAKRDCQIQYIYTTSGIALVKPGVMVKKGQELITGLEVSDVNTAIIPAVGEVIGKTWYEDSIEFIPNKLKKIRTGKKVSYYYLQIGQNIFFSKNNINKFQTYDKIVTGSYLFKRIDIYETKFVDVDYDLNILLTKYENILYNKMLLDLDKSVKILDKKTDYTKEGDKIHLRLMLTGEENVAVSQMQ